MKVELVLEIEYLVAPEFIRRKWMIGRETPAKSTSTLNKWFRYVFPQKKADVATVAVAAVTVSSGDNETKKGAEKDTDAYENVVEEISVLKQNVGDIKMQQDSLDKLITAITTKFDISSSEFTWFKNQLPCVNIKPPYRVTTLPVVTFTHLKM